ncbi:MAG: hypothetical protein KatS3mg102_1117 [Planctomycetota bacterium]|nr:MAG: hypothetical protein KatS3mg102_1117 [Planctomycetota bacterium]
MCLPVRSTALALALGWLGPLAAVAPPAALAQDRGATAVVRPRPLRFAGLWGGAGITLLDPERSGRQTLRHLDLHGEWLLGPIALGIDLDLRFDDLTGLTLRDEDWDEPSDWLRWLEFAELGRPGGSYHLGLGPLRDYRLGHGTLLDHYWGELDFDSPKTGARGSFELGYLGAQAVLNDLTAVEVFGGRAALRPLHDPQGPAGAELALTGQIVADRRAPERLRLDGMGQPRFDSRGNLEVATEAVYGWGVGAELPALPLLGLELLPYFEYNRLEPHFGWGAHFGLEFAWQLPVLQLQVLARAEHREMGAEYLPVYFGPLYEVDRFRYPDPGSPLTRQQFLDGVPAQRSWLGEATFTISSFLVRTSFEALERTEQHNLYTLAAAIEGVDGVWLELLYAKRGVRQFEEVFSFDDRTAMRVRLQLVLGANAWIDAQFSRTFILERDRRRLEPLDAYALAILFGGRF